MTFWLYVTLRILATNASAFYTTSVTQMPNWHTCIAVGEHVKKITESTYECKVEK